MSMSTSDLLEYHYFPYYSKEDLLKKVETWAFPESAKRYILDKYDKRKNEREEFQKRLSGGATLEQLIEGVKGVENIPSVEVVMDRQHKVLIVGGAGLTSTMLKHLNAEFGNDLIVHMPEEAIKNGLSSELIFKQEPIPITPTMAQHPQVFIDKHNNKPWYSKFQNKRGKKRK